MMHLIKLILPYTTYFINYFIAVLNTVTRSHVIINHSMSQKKVNEKSPGKIMK